VTGFGLGMAMPTALNVALGTLSAERSGSGSALITAMRQVGGTIGVAVLGTVLATVYRGGLHLSGDSAKATAAIKSSVAAGVATAKAARSSSLLDLVRTAYVHGLDDMLWVCAGIALASALLALAFLPRWQAPAPDPADPAAVSDAAPRSADATIASAGSVRAE
jgi:MFS transporter, DHA2 family, multidrug resistance protein